MSEHKKHEVHIQKGKESADGSKKEHHAEDKKEADEGELVTRTKNHVGDIDLLKKEIESRDKTVSEYLNQIKRTQADFENYRKRVEKEKEDIALEEKRKILCEMITVADDLDRSIAASKKNHDAESLAKGVEMVYKKLMSTFAKEGIAKIESTGKQFDPRLHEAVAVEESKNIKDNTVIEELEKGYIFKNKVLRPAKVKVARNE